MDKRKREKRKVVLNRVWNKFIVLEGIDGSGTTTQLGLLEQKFQEKGLPVFATFEPSDGPIGTLVRRILRKELPTTPQALAKLFAADREDHLYLRPGGIQDHLDDDYWVICDRYFFSSLVYQSMDLPYQEVWNLNKNFPLPQYLFFVDVVGETAAKRRAERKKEELFESSNIQNRIIKGYEKVLGEFLDSAMQIHRINGENSPTEILQEICTKFMKRIFFFFLILLTPLTLWSYNLRFAEEFYRLYHRHFYENPTNVVENIFWLEKALASDFANPLNALARIENQTQWEKYRYLFYTHVNLKLVEQHLQLGRNFDKQKAYFFNAPWRDTNIRSLEKAEQAYTMALYYWDHARMWSKRASRWPWIDLAEIRYWQDESWRIENGELDYKRIIDGHIARVRRVRAEFEAMDENTY